MNDDLVVQKISKLLESNTSFIGYALNGGVGTKINVRNTETGKTIQALSINVDSVGEVLVVKDSTDNQYKAVTFKVAEKVSEKIIQIRKTKPTDDKKIIEYTDVDIEVFYLFVKLIDTGSPVATSLQSTWIRKGNSCTQFVGAYERCNYASKKTIAGVSYTGLPYQTYASLTECLNDDLGPDAKTPHGTSNENGGGGAGWKYFSTQVSGASEQNMLAALTSHDAYYNTSYKKLFGYGSILECSGAMNLQGWEFTVDSTTGQSVLRCEFSYLPGFSYYCTPAMQAAGYCDARGFISSKAPLLGQEAPGQPSVRNVQNDWGHTYGWVNLPYTFMYKRHFSQSYLDGATAPGGFYILEVNDDQVPSNLPPGYFPWVPGCPGNAPNGGPYDGSGGNRFPDGVAPIQKRDMKLSTHKAEIWLGSSKKTEAIKLYELGASDLFSGMYNAFILAANESTVDTYKRANINTPITVEQQLLHDTYYTNWNKNIIDLRINPRVWIYILDNIPGANYIYPSIENYDENPSNFGVQLMVDNLYNRTINLTVVDKDTQIIHLKLGLSASNQLSNTDCKGIFNGFGKAVPNSDFLVGQSWQYQKNITIKVKKWKIDSTTNTLDTTNLGVGVWNKSYIEKQFYTFFSNLQTANASSGSNNKDYANNVFLRNTNSTSLVGLTSGNNYEQYNYCQAKLFNSNHPLQVSQYFVNSYSKLIKPVVATDTYRYIFKSSSSWWSLWDRTHYSSSTKRLSSIVGFDVNNYQILTSMNLPKSLNYDSSFPNNRQVSRKTYYEYVPSRPLVYVPSAIRSSRNDLLSVPSVVEKLKTRKLTLDNYGTNLFYSFLFSQWTQTYSQFLKNTPSSSFLDMPSSYYDFPYKTLTLEHSLYITAVTSYTGNFERKMDTDRWFNFLWAQLIYEGSIKVDVDSYKEVTFTLPTNPSKYIKYAIREEYTTPEYPFALFKDQDLDTVLSPGKLDVTKQVPIKKPTNVELDPNMSFLVYLFPFVSVTKKKKEI